MKENCALNLISFLLFHAAHALTIFEIILFILNKRTTYMWPAWSFVLSVQSQILVLFCKHWIIWQLKNEPLLHDPPDNFNFYLFCLFIRVAGWQTFLLKSLNPLHPLLVMQFLYDSTIDASSWLRFLWNRKYFFEKLSFCENFRRYCRQICLTVASALIFKCTQMFIDLFTSP